jgi:trimeric autotransporter adhesin
MGTSSFNLSSNLSAKGDLVTYTGTGTATLTVGTNGQLLSADSAQTGGVKWLGGASGVIVIPGVATLTITNGLITSIT